MTPTTSRQSALSELGGSALRWLAGWWRIVHLGAQILALAVSPSTYRLADRSALSHQIYLSTAPNLMWFTALSALLSLVLIRIVLVTAFSYGLSQYALEMVVRVLVLELIPLTAALFVAFRCTIPYAAEIGAMGTQPELGALKLQGTDLLHHEVLPRALAGMCAMLMLASVSCVLTLVLAYLSAYGFTRWGLEGYTPYGRADLRTGGVDHLPAENRVDERDRLVDSSGLGSKRTGPHARARQRRDAGAGSDVFWRSC